MLIRLRHTAANRTDERATEHAWVDALVEHTTTYEAALLLIPDGEELRQRLYETTRVLGHYESLGQSFDTANLWLDVSALEAIQVLSAFLRDEPLPAPSPAFLELEGMVEAHRQSTSDPS